MRKPQSAQAGFDRPDAARGKLITRLELRAGDEARIIEQADGALRVESPRAAARALIGSAGRVEPSVVQELRAERRAQAAAEDRDAAREGR